MKAYIDEEGNPEYIIYCLREVGNCTSYQNEEDTK
jgi:hypothetical protein